MSSDAVRVLNGQLTKNRVPSIIRAFTIMELLAERKKGLTTSEISRRLKLPKSSASCILRTLEERGYLCRDDHQGKYRVTLRLFSVGSQALHGLELTDIALPIIQGLVDETGLTGHLAILDGYEAVYIQKVEKPGMIKVNTWVGRRLDMHSTAVGKALTAYLPQATVEKIIKEKGLHKHTPKTIISPRQLFSELGKVKAAGYALCHSEHSPDVNCIAAPIFNIQGNVEAAVGLTGTESQMRLLKMDTYVRLIKQAARNLSHRRGYDGRARRTVVTGKASRGAPDR